MNTLAAKSSIWQSKIKHYRYIYIYMYIYIYIYISLCIYIYIKILGIGAELKNLCIKQQKNFVSLPTENLKTWVFDFRTPPKYIYEWVLE